MYYSPKKIKDPTSVVPIKIPDPTSIAIFNSGPNSDAAKENVDFYAIPIKLRCVIHKLSKNCKY